MHVLTIIPLNINGLQSSTTVTMLHHFLRRYEVDILFVQEVTDADVLQMQGYMAHCNLGTTMRGTAFLSRNGINLKNIVRMPTGRAIAASYQGVLLLNIHIHAPSSTSQKAEREQFYNLELPTLLRIDVQQVVLRLCGTRVYIFCNI
jgi:exonuclease III